MPTDLNINPITYDWEIPTITNPYTTTNIANVLGQTINVHFENTTYVTIQELDNILKKIHKIITEHIKLDITEEEFIDILKGDKQ